MWYFVFLRLPDMFLGGGNSKILIFTLIPGKRIQVDYLKVKIDGTDTKK